MIDPNGNIIKCSPSHAETLLKYAMREENKTRQEIIDELPMEFSPFNLLLDKYGLISVWYSGYLYGTYNRDCPTDSQIRSLEALIDNSLITENFVIPAVEYGLYLKRKDTKRKASRIIIIEE